MKRKQFFGAAGSLFLASIMLTACVSGSVEDTNVTNVTSTVDISTEAPKVVSPITEYSSVEEINKIVGCKLGGPGVMGVSAQNYCVINADVPIAQYSFAVSGIKCTLRAGRTAEDISGVYYSGKTLGVHMDAQEGAGADGILETESGRYARWFDGDMQYSFYMDKTEGMTMETFADIAEEFKRITGVSVSQTAKIPEISGENHELTLTADGAEEPLLVYEYETYTVTNEGFDALKQALEKHFGEVAAAMEAEYEESVKERQQIESDYAGAGRINQQWASQEQFTVTRLDEKVLSGFETYYTYFGGAHPGTMIVGVNFDTVSGEELRIHDIVQDYDGLYQQVLDYLENDFEYRDGLFPDYRDTVKAFFYPNESSEYPYELQWYLEDSDLVILFNTYDIAPYVMGRIEVRIGLE